MYKLSVCSSNKDFNVLKNQVKALQTKLTAYTIANEKLTTQVSQLNSTIADYKATASVTETTGKIYMDGVQVSAVAKFANINGTQYVSADGFISTLTNKTDAEYKYVDSTKSLYIGAMPADGGISLTSLKYYEIAGNIFVDQWHPDDEFLINGEKIYNGLGFGEGNTAGQWIKYKINCNYKQLKFRVAVDDHTIGTGYKGGITIVGDGNVLYDSGILEAQDAAPEQTINISDVKD
ncbi:NPCBM/NEW2 domain-containing protein [Clostridium estertheticum]|uniref:NPCBM/NEW2 domain-containing protein n=1 Tax=Clostridium estertheticum TaxID=238834 RepID=UPI001C0E1E79|nr:NPCBM/NEW2 domain-containing protein [Clostridium estertheticum]MBU3198519.1 NPCBM/NEW2 domain-containing protein [Clostridium estertheticum]WAG64500.1 NPCBM/NEW2 domain-containing protein [Clostridium estertheticum]